MQLNIHTPCSENWNNMKPVENGRHCSSCQKSVHDFSSYSDEQLIDFFQKKNEYICGKFGEDQLNRPLIFTKPVNTFQNKWMAAFIGVFTFLKAAEAQSIQPKDENGFVQKETKKEPAFILKVTKGTDLKGVVKNAQTGEPVKGVGVMIEGIGNSCTTDAEGKFKISSDEIKQHSNLVLKFFHASFTTKEVTVVYVKEKIMDTIRLETGYVELEACRVSADRRVTVMGGPMSYNIVTAEPTHRSKIKNFFYRLFHWRKKNHNQKKENEE